MTEREFLEKEIERWKVSPARKMMITGQLYYEGEQDILLRKRTAIGQGGQLEEIDNLLNSHVVDNQYAKLVNQKADYLLGQPFVVRGDSAEYVKMLKKVFNKGFMKALKNVGKGVLNWGIAWIYPYLDPDEGICIKVIPGYEVLPFWKDSEHTRLDKAVRVYKVCGYEGKRPVVIEKAEVYTESGVERFILDKGRLVPDTAGGERGFLSLAAEIRRRSGRMITAEKEAKKVVVKEISAKISKQICEEMRAVSDTGGSRLFPLGTMRARYRLSRELSLCRTG
ncbi:MAG: phage portal protein [Ruminiclostridium sp.]|nr:phage portal protein [Ruminiclostridium sp.]